MATSHIKFPQNLPQNHKNLVKSAQIPSFKKTQMPELDCTQNGGEPKSLEEENRSKERRNAGANKNLGHEQRRQQTLLLFHSCPSLAPSLILQSYQPSSLLQSVPVQSCKGEKLQ